MPNIIELPLKDAKLIQLNKKVDQRGWFLELFRQSWIDEAKISNKFIFEYTSKSTEEGTIRGMHAQTSKQPMSKLVTVLNGSIQDVIVDARIDSPTYGKSCEIFLDDTSLSLVYIPRGFYHGFKTLSKDTYVYYKLDNYYNKDEECGFMYNDLSLSIDWKLSKEPIISQRDTTHPSWKNAYKFQGVF